MTDRSSLPRFDESAVAGRNRGRSGHIQHNHGIRSRRGVRGRRSDHSDSCCDSGGCASRCNSQICCSYLLALVSSALVVAGVYISLWKWNRIWLILSVSGMVLILFGACMYYCGTEALAAQYSHECDEYDYEDDGDEEDVHGGRGRRKRKKRYRGDDHHLVPSASDSVSRSLSQLSLNMIPQYFSPSDTNSTLLRNQSASGASSSGLANSSGVPFSQIFSVNGQSYLILPLAGDCVRPPPPIDLNNPLVSNGPGTSATTGDVCIPLDSLVLSSKMPKDDTSSLSSAGPDAFR